jgi:hypothetical protein
LRAGAVLARRHDMMKPLLVVALVCGPALADPPPATVNLELAVHAVASKDARRYQIALVDQSCGQAKNKSATVHDEIKACMRVDGAAFRLELDWLTRDGDRELQSHAVALAKRGEVISLDNDRVRLDVAVQ